MSIGPPKILKRDINERCNFSLNRKIKAAFQHECYMNEVNMSSVLEKFMVSYTNASRSLKEIQKRTQDEG